MAIINKKIKGLPAGRQGFTIFFAMLVGSLALAVGAAIYDLTVRELDLSGTATQSQYAIYAADTGAECALYWDFKCGSGLCSSSSAGSAFATSSTSAKPLASTGIACNGIDITNAISNPTAASASAATTTFTITFSPQAYCVTVQVEKSEMPTLTKITAKGYNTCAAAGVTRLERVLQVTY